MNTTDTIAAVATGSAVSAIGIVRVSGENALTAADSIFRAAKGIKLKDAQDRQMYYGELTGKHGGFIDLCLCMVSRGPNSYTGEDTAEFHCHGSPIVLSEVLQALFEHGVRQAQAGEFTKRAFLNGRMDLTQAEAVIDLIEAESPLMARNAAGQLRGAVHEKLDSVYNKLIDIMAHFHAVIDYPDEDIEKFKMQSYLPPLRGCEAELCRLLDTHERGKVLRSGIPTAIIGRTNAGKSSLLNALLGYERAIVTDIHGTTRDTVQEKLLAGNVLLRLTDTAGLRKTDDTVEKLGTERTMAAMAEAGLILFILDGSEPLQEDDYSTLQTTAACAGDTPVIYVVNKSDLPQRIGNIESIITSPVIKLSAKAGQGLELLTDEIQKLFPDPDYAQIGEIITNARQAETIGRANESLKRAMAAITDSVSPDAVLTDIEAALAAIGEVSGQNMREGIVSRIFERFCVGK